MRGRRVAVESILLSLLFWAAFVAYGNLRPDSHWPRATPAVEIPGVPQLDRPAISAAENWENFLLVAIESQAAFTIAYCSARRTKRWGWTAAALTAFVGALAVVLAYSLLAGIRGWETTPFTRRFILRGPLDVIGVVGAVAMLAIKDEPKEGTTREDVP